MPDPRPAQAHPAPRARRGQAAPRRRRLARRRGALKSRPDPPIFPVIMGKVTGKSYSTDLPASPPSHVLAECYAAFERAAGLDVGLMHEQGRLVIELEGGPLRPSELFDLLDRPSSS